MITNHYGITVDSEKPVTGVFSNNRIEFLSEEIFAGNYVGLCQEDYLEEIYPKEEEEFDGDMGSEDFLIGFIKTTDKEKAFYWYPKRKIGYMPDEKAEYSTIIREFTSQVVRSNWFIRGALCSPCYPGQVDADTSGEFLAYSLSPDVIGEESKNYKIFKEGREKK
jgi:hypothetical protein